MIENNKFYIKSKKDGKPAFNNSFEKKSLAENFLKQLPLTEHFEIDFNNPSRCIKRILSEGLAKGDLEDILSPVVSFDEYVPKNESSNIVIGLYVLNEPLVVEPLQDFCDKAQGVVESDISDSDTISNASVVYVEFKRRSESKEYIIELIKDLGKVAGRKLEDFIITFPNSDRKFPFRQEFIDLYFKRLVE